jgi:hypothetical protein
MIALEPPTHELVVPQVGRPHKEDVWRTYSVVALVLLLLLACGL